MTVTRCGRAAPPVADDESPGSGIQPGLFVEYASPALATGAVTIRGRAAQPALWLAAGESPDVRLPSEGWTAVWQGMIDILRAGEYRFWVASAGAVRLELDGREVLDLAAWDGAAAAPPPSSTVLEVTNQVALRGGESLRLDHGLHRCVVSYVARPGENQLRFYWESPEQFPLEPVPSRIWTHRVNDPQAAAYPASDTFEEGQRQFEEHRCARCHRLSPESRWVPRLTELPAPRLTDARGRLRRSWVFQWLDQPADHRPQATMPRLFSDDGRGAVERYVLASYLGSDTDAAIADDPARIAEGEALFWQRGCTVCHLPRDGEPERISLRHIAQKFLPGALAAFLQDPLASHPAGLMPDMQLSAEESQSLAAYLSQPGDVADEAVHAHALPAPPTLDVLADVFATAGADADARAVARGVLEPLSDEQRTARIAMELLSRRRCVACHEGARSEAGVTPPAPVGADWTALLNRRTEGCLSRQVGAGFPRFGAALDRLAVQQFLDVARTAPASPAPGAQARRTLARLNCTGCHRRDEAGGIDGALAARLLHGQSAEQAEALTPPALTGVSDRLTAGYLREVLELGRRSRPWMSLRMPKFPAERVRELAAGLAAVDGVRLRPAAGLAAAEPELIESGRRLVGSAGFGCIKCHDMLGIPSGGTRGPELSLVTERVHREWFLRWMTDPQRIQPGTRMPTVFLDGQSPYSDVLEGDPARQREALWAYLAHSRAQAAPEGLARPRPLHLAVEGRPRVVRTFLPELTPRSMAIGFPSGVHVAFDAQRCRLAYAFAGEFLGMTPVWTDRGGRPAEVLGSRIWDWPGGFPWALTERADGVPDLTGREQDPSWGAVPPDDGRLHPSRLYFRGYRVADDAVTLRYAWQAAEAAAADGASTDAADSATVASGEVSRDAALAIQERILTRQAGYAQGVVREFELAVPARRVLWLEVARSVEPVRFYRAMADGGALAAEATQAPSEAAAAWTSSHGACVAHLRGGSEPGEWVAVPQAGGWSLWLVLPAQADDRTGVRWNLACWRTTAEAALRARLVQEELAGELP